MTAKLKSMDCKLLENINPGEYLNLWSVKIENKIIKLTSVLCLIVFINAVQ